MQDKLILNVKDVVKILWGQKVKIIGFTILIGIVVTFINLFLLQPIYESRVSIVVGKEQSDETVQYNSDFVVMYQKLIKTYAEIAGSEKVLRKTIDDLELNYDHDEYKKFVKSISILPKADTQIIEIIVENKDSELARDIAGAISKNFINEARSILPAAQLNLLDEAKKPIEPIKPNKTLNILIFTSMGCVLITTIYMLKGLESMKIVTEKDVEEYLDLKVIGNIIKW